jgi:hypothetical protein
MLQMQVVLKDGISLEDIALADLTYYFYPILVSDFLSPHTSR